MLDMGGFRTFERGVACKGKCIGARAPNLPFTLRRYHLTAPLGDSTVLVDIAPIVLNVAGPRASGAPGIERFTQMVLDAGFPR